MNKKSEKAKTKVRKIKLSQLHPIFQIYVDLHKKNKGKRKINLVTPDKKEIEIQLRPEQMITVISKQGNCQIKRMFKLIFPILFGIWMDVPGICPGSLVEFPSPANEKIMLAAGTYNPLSQMTVRSLELDEFPDLKKELDCLAETIKKGDFE